MNDHGTTSGAGRVLFIGTPTDPLELARWVSFRDGMLRRGLEVASSTGPEAIECESIECESLLAAIVTDDVLDGICRPDEALALQRVRAADVRCLSVHDDPSRLGSGADDTDTADAARDSRSQRHRAALRATA